MKESVYLNIILTYVPTLFTVIVAIALLIIANKNRTKIDIAVFIGAAIFLLGRVVTVFSFKSTMGVGLDGHPVNIEYVGTMYGYYITIIGLGIASIGLLIKAIKK